MLVLFAAKTDGGVNPVPDLDLTGAEPQVATKIRMLIDQVQQNPESAGSWGKLAVNLDVHDFKLESIPCYKKASELDPKEFKWPYYAAITLYDLGSAEALIYFKRSSALKAKYGPAHFRYGQALLDAGRVDEAVREFQLAAEHSPDTSHPYLGLARVASIKGDYEQSMAHLLEAIRRNPKHGEAHGLLAEIYRRKNDPMNANREQLLALQSPGKTPPDDPLLFDLINEGVSSFWYEWRGRAYLQKGAYSAAIKELRSAVKALPDARLYDLLGIALQYAKSYKEAAEQHQAALALQPNSAGTLNNLATALTELGRFTEALAYVKEAIESEPDFLYSHLHLSSLYLKSGNQAEAIAVLKRAHQQFSTDTAIALRLSWLLSTALEKQLRDGKRAVQLAEESCKQNGYTDAECLDVLAAAYAETGEFQKAAEMAAKALGLAELDQKTELTKRIRDRLKKYKENRPHHE